MHPYKRHHLTWASPSGFRLFRKMECWKCESWSFSNRASSPAKRNPFFLRWLSRYPSSAKLAHGFRLLLPEKGSHRFYSLKDILDSKLLFDTIVMKHKFFDDFYLNCINLDDVWVRREEVDCHTEVALMEADSDEQRCHCFQIRAFSFKSPEVLACTKVEDLSPTQGPTGDLWL